MKSVFAILVLFLFYSCNTPSSNSQSEDKIMESEISLAAPAIPNGNNTQPIDSTLKVIKSANLSFETEDSNRAIQKINEILKSLKGYTEQEDSNASDNQLFTSIKCRVPSSQFESFIGRLEGIPAKMTGKNIQRLDVTKEYIETETTINAQKELLNRYVQLLAKANKMSDMLEIENKLSELKTAIEISQNRFNSLKKQIRYSEIQINITSSSSQITRNSFGSDITNAFSNGIDLLKSLLIGIITLWPILIVVGALTLIYKRYKRHKISRKL
ncbi:hypothetical protein Pedsa_3389 [Pseudopedobacter saltans DSM 12145]|uniref:DUF4349 domain-containing protein n=1 Tax=Pseudopedobacter saltans (strain ATCC 51119 / DSM 12145 / JCM 21818 / CCUG 39354 / LMG 10337 / NBRC 100064 / NCIMB 13643) TaxID=762903 RepID=F0SDE1_PSESL|nr:DUF4349 domain-containing protein [Pseudopedobacter saltans]ADY53924.1 hypothetical protein Pedsa_3389 [Pseudopedobacter saltans DSM 12145]